MQQFIGAFRKIQCNMRMDLSSSSNCRMFDLHLPDNLFFSNIYFVSSRRARVTMNEQTYENQNKSILKLIGEEDMNESIEEFYDSIDEMHQTRYILDGTSNFMNTYIAAQIERKIMQCKNFHCNNCLSVFDENEKNDSIDSNVLQWKPCISTVEICKTAEKFFKLHNIDAAKPEKPRYDFKVLYCLVFRSMDLTNLYPESEFICDVSHKYQFIKCIVGQYFNVRASQIARQITLENQGDLVRQQWNRLVNFRSQ